MTDQTVILGAGGHAKVVLSTLLANDEIVHGLYDDDPAKLGQKVIGVPVLGSLDQVPRGAHAILGIGSETIRKVFAERFDLDWRSSIHPAATVDPSAVLGEGTVVFAGAVVQPSVQVGRHAVINTAATIDHDSEIGDYAQLAPGVHTGGNVHIGEGAFIGTGASVCPGVRIGAWAVIGAGAVVTRDIPDRTMAVGVPAKVVREIQQVEP